MLKLINVSPKHDYKQYFNISFPSSGVIYLKGAVGSFKTTLLNIIAGLDKNYSGTVISDKKTSLVCQDFCLVNDLSVFEYVAMQYKLSGKYDKQVENEIINTLALVELKELKDVLIKNLSTGQKQRVAIANTFASDADILLFDEPTANLDESLSNKIMQHIKLLGVKKLVILVSHDNQKALNIADKVIKISSISSEEPTSSDVYVKKSKNKTAKLKYANAYFKQTSPIRSNFFVMLGAIFVSLAIMFLANYINSLVNPLEDKFHSQDPYFSHVSRVDSNTSLNDVSYIPILNTSATLLNVSSIELFESAQLYYMHENIKLLYGRTPKKDNEVIISLSAWQNLSGLRNTLSVYGIRNINDLIGETINIGFANEKAYKIVGISDANYDAIYLLDQKAVYQHQHCFVNTSWDEQFIYFSTPKNFSSIRYITAKYQDIEYILPKSCLSENEVGEIYVSISDLSNITFDMLDKFTFSLFDDNADINSYFVKNMKNLIYHDTYNMAVVDQIAKEAHIANGVALSKILVTVFVIIVAITIAHICNWQNVDFMLVGRCKLYDVSIIKLNILLSKKLYILLAMISVYSAALSILTKNTISSIKITGLIVLLIACLSFIINIAMKKYLFDDCRTIFKKDKSYQ